MKSKKISNDQEPVHELLGQTSYYIKESGPKSQDYKNRFRSRLFSARAASQILESWYLVHFFIQIKDAFGLGMNSLANNGVWIRSVHDLTCCGSFSSTDCTYLLKFQV